MKILNRCVTGLYVLCGLTATLGILAAWATNGALLARYYAFLKQDAHLFKTGIGALGIVLIGVFWLVQWFDFMYHSRAISFNNPGGRVNVSLRAIEQFISSRILTQIPGVHSIRVRTALNSRGLETRIYLKLLAGTNIPETCAHIQEITKNYLQDVVGVERIASIEISVSNIIAMKNNSPEKPVDNDAHAET